MKIKIQDKILEYSAPVTVYDAAKDAELITRAVIGAQINGSCKMITEQEYDEFVGKGKTAPAPAAKA